MSLSEGDKEDDMSNYINESGMDEIKIRPHLVGDNFIGMRVEKNRLYTDAIKYILNEYQPYFNKELDDDFTHVPIETIPTETHGPNSQIFIVDSPVNRGKTLFTYLGNVMRNKNHKESLDGNAYLITDVKIPIIKQNKDGEWRLEFDEKRFEYQLGKTERNLLAKAIGKNIHLLDAPEYCKNKLERFAKRYSD